MPAAVSPALEYTSISISSVTPLFAVAVIVIVPVAVAVRSPFSSMVAIVSSLTLHSISLYVVFSGRTSALS